MSTASLTGPALPARAAAPSPARASGTEAPQELFVGAARARALQPAAAKRFTETAGRLRESPQELGTSEEGASQPHGKPREVGRREAPRGEVLPLKEEAIAFVHDAHASRLEARADRGAVLVMDDARRDVQDAPSALARAPGEIDVLPVEGRVERIEPAEREPEGAVVRGRPSA